MQKQNPRDRSPYPRNRPRVLTHNWFACELARLRRLALQRKGVRR